MNQSFNSAYFLDRAAWAHPHRVSVRYGERSWSVNEAAQETLQIAQLLRRSGVRSSDRVAVIARNSPYHLFFHVACARLGAVFVPVSYRFMPAELERIIDTLAPAVIVADPETAVALGELFGQASSSDFFPQRFVIDDDADASLPNEIAPSSGTLDRARAAGWMGLASELERLNRDAEKTEPSVCLHSSRASDCCVPDCCGEVESPESADSPSLLGYPEGLAAIVLTSGSAGAPKFVPLTHENLWWGSQNFREGFEYSTMDTELVAAPLSHIGGLNGTTMDLFSHGGCVVIVRQFHPDVVLRELERHRVAIMFAVPTMYSLLMDLPRFAHTDLSHFRLPLTGGSSPSPDLLARLNKAGLRALNVWGMTETSASGCYLPADLLPSKAGSIGRPFAHVQARIVDTVTGQTLAREMAGKLQPQHKYKQGHLPEVEGELWLRGPSVVTAYWDPDDSAGGAEDAAVDKPMGAVCGSEKRGARDSLCSSVSAEDSSEWLHTGDIVRLDSSGCLWVVGRIDEMINTGGEKVSPAEVERVIAAYPGVADVAVTGIADERWGQIVAAVIVMASGVQAPSLDEVRDFSASILADYKRPHALRIVDSLPLNSNGKLDRRAVAQLCGDLYPSSQVVGFHDRTH